MSLRRKVYNSGCSVPQASAANVFGGKSVVCALKAGDAATAGLDRKSWIQLLQTIESFRSRRALGINNRHDRDLWPALVPEQHSANCGGFSESEYCNQYHLPGLALNITVTPPAFSIQLRPNLVRRNGDAADGREYDCKSSNFPNRRN